MRRLGTLILIAVAVAACAAPTAGPANPSTSVPPSAEPTRPPDCPATYPDPKPYGESAYVGAGTVVSVDGPSLVRATVDVPSDHPFAGRTLLLHIHGTARLPGGAHDLTAIGLRAGDRISINVWKFIPEDCSYSVISLERL